MKKKIILAICVVGLMLVSSGVSVNAITIGNKQDFDITVDNSMPQKLNECPINITVQEAWDLLTDTGNGIQIPIDVRYDYEWYSGFIDTPWPECPIWYEKDLFQNNATWLQWFIDEYAGQEIVIYCKGGYRSLIVSNILCGAGFTGTVYNMLGGITAWIDAGYPIRNNTPPDAPDIDGPLKIKKDAEVNFAFTATDPENDAVYYFIDWDDGNTEETDTYTASGEEVTVKHSWNEKGTYNIKAKAVDFYGNESDWSELEVIVPRIRTSTINSLFLQLLERFPNTFPILRQIQGMQ